MMRVKGQNLMTNCAPCVTSGPGGGAHRSTSGPRAGITIETALMKTPSVTESSKVR